MKFLSSLTIFLALVGVSEASKLLVGLKCSLESQQRLDDAFWSVSDPDHSVYAQHLSYTEMYDIMRCDDIVFDRATAWMLSVGARSVSVTGTGDYLVGEWSGDGKPPSVPSHLQDVIGLVMVTAPKSLRVVAGAPGRLTVSAGSSGMDLESQKKAYGVPLDLAGSNPNNLQMVWGTGTFGYREDDLSMFYSNYCPSCNISAVGFDKDNVWDGKTGDNFGEGTLDVSYLSGMTQNTRTLVSNTNSSASTEAGESFGAAFLAFLVDLNARGSDPSDDFPLVLSLSLGSLAFESCDYLCKGIESKGGHSYAQCWDYLQTQFQVCMFESEDLQNRVNTEFQKLGARGTTVFAASGDGGSHFAFSPFNSGGMADALNEIACTERNMPVFPTASPYVVSVGGIAWQADSMYGPSCSSETPCGWSGGGGGFSWQFSADYQSSIPSDYVAAAKKIASSIMTPDGTYNAAGRGYPDLSALAAPGIPLCTFGGCSGAGGTSASAPTVAGLFSLINDHRLNNGLKPLGFINPRLYKLMADADVYAECFTDVGIDKVGDLWDCDTFSTCTGCDTGFPAVPGWDAQTGFGQPKWAGLLKHFGN